MQELLQHLPWRWRTRHGPPSSLLPPTPLNLDNPTPALHFISAPDAPNEEVALANGCFSPLPATPTAMPKHHPKRTTLAFVPPTPDASDEEVAQAAAVAHIHSSIVGTFKKGYNTRVGEWGSWALCALPWGHSPFVGMFKMG